MNINSFFIHLRLLGINKFNGYRKFNLIIGFDLSNGLKVKTDDIYLFIVCTTHKKFHIISITLFWSAKCANESFSPDFYPKIDNLCVKA